MRDAMHAYCCPNCFTQQAYNDFFFARHVSKKGKDLRKLRYWEAVHPDETGADGIRCLADWRSYPEELRIIDGDRITALRDYDGELLTLRICPKCRFALPEEERTRQLMFWSEQGLNETLGRAFFDRLAREDSWKVEQLPADPENRLFPVYTARWMDWVLRMPYGFPTQDSVSNRAVYQQYMNNADAAVVVLNADAENSNLDAIECLMTYTELHGPRGTRDYRTTAVVIRVDEKAEEIEDDGAWLKKHHPNMHAAIACLLLDFTIVIWQEGTPFPTRRVADWCVMRLSGTEPMGCCMAEFAGEQEEPAGEIGKTAAQSAQESDPKAPLSNK